MEPQTAKSFVITFDVDMLIETGSVFLEHGTLPYTGGWLDQPRWWTEAMTQIYIPMVNRRKYETMSPEEQAMFVKRPPKKEDTKEDKEW